MSDMKKCESNENEIRKHTLTMNGYFINVCMCRRRDYWRVRMRTGEIEKWF